MTEFTHAIIRMERAATKNSASPMWRCTTRDGERVNIFQHSDPAKDNTLFFKEAGYFDLMESLRIGEALEWQESPIWVVMKKTPDGQWWTITDVLKRPHDAEPDALWQPNLKQYKQRAVYQAHTLISRSSRFLDLELTGLRPDDEITAIAILDNQGTILLDTLVRPTRPEKLLKIQKTGQSASDVTGITPEMLADAPTFYEVWPKLHQFLDGCHWVAYNAKFDCEALDRECSNWDQPLLTAAGVHDAARLAAEYLGNWQPKRQWFETLTLVEAATQLGVQVDVSHRAAADARTCLSVLKAIANDVNGEPF